MNDTAPTSSQPGAALPADDPRRHLAVANSDDKGLRHIGISGGDTYTIVLTGQDTNGRYCLIDMLIPPGGGPPPHRHDFEEMFTVLEGELAVTFRGEENVAGVGTTVNSPANAPHAFTNKTGKPTRLLCICSPAGQEEFFMAVGVPVEGRTTSPPRLTKAEQADQTRRAEMLAPKYRTEFLTA